MSELAKRSVEHLTDEFYGQVREVLAAARANAYHAVNFAMVRAYWEIGRMIVEEVGEDGRDKYGKRLLAELSRRLTDDFGAGFEERNLRYMRQFFKSFPIRNALRSELSWTHYRVLTTVKDPEARMWYMEECVSSNWSTRQLKRQIDTMFRERLLATKEENRPSVAAEVFKREPPKRPEDIIRDPYVLEFLGMRQSDSFYESELESALIEHLQEFLLEMGRGFSFVARQKRISFDGQHFYIDLVFYNYLLRCWVLIDLKTGTLTHQDLGQMQMYVNYYTREMMNEYDNKPIGILLCADKSDSVVRYTLPEDNDQVFAAKYLTQLPSVEELQQELNAEYRALADGAVETVGDADE